MSETLQYTDIMIDIETLSTEIDAIICSIGAVAFNIKDKTIDKDNALYIPIDWNKQMTYRHLSVGTLKFWLGSTTPQISKDQLLIGTDQLPHALQKLKSFYEKYEPDLTNKKVKVWSKGSMFDFPILHHAYRYHNVYIPWSYKNIRDTRTYLDIFDIDPTNDIAHNALEDCLIQISDMFKVQ